RGAGVGGPGRHDERRLLPGARDERHRKRHGGLRLPGRLSATGSDRSARPLPLPTVAPIRDRIVHSASTAGGAARRREDDAMSRGYGPAAGEGDGAPSSVLDRVFAILDAVKRAHGEVPVAEVAASAGIPKSTTARLVGE